MSTRGHRGIETPARPPGRAGVDVSANRRQAVSRARCGVLDGRASETSARMCRPDGPMGECSFAMNGPRIPPTAQLLLRRSVRHCPGSFHRERRAGAIGLVPRPHPHDTKGIEREERRGGDADGQAEGGRGANEKLRDPTSDPRRVDPESGNNDAFLGHVTRVDWWAGAGNVTLVLKAQPGGPGTACGSSLRMNRSAYPSARSPRSTDHHGRTAVASGFVHDTPGEHGVAIRRTPAFGSPAPTRLMFEPPVYCTVQAQI